AATRASARRCVRRAHCDPHRCASCQATSWRDLCSLSLFVKSLACLSGLQGMHASVCALHATSPFCDKASPNNRYRVDVVHAPPRGTAIALSTDYEGLLMDDPLLKAALAACAAAQALCKEAEEVRDAARQVRRDAQRTVDGLKNGRSEPARAPAVAEGARASG